MMKKKFLAMLTLCCMLSGAGCDLSALLGGGTTSTDDSSATVGGIEYQNLLGAQAAKTLAVGETVTFTVGEDLGDKNYMKLAYSADVNLYGEFIYSDLSNPDKVVEECFYLDGTDTEFKQFLENGLGNLKRRIGCRP